MKLVTSSDAIPDGRPIISSVILERQKAERWSASILLRRDIFSGSDLHYETLARISEYLA